jgi:glycosyltransferase involved in cell wall biosynthesis
VALYSDSELVGGAERSLLNLAHAYDGAYELVICGPSQTFLNEAARLAPGVRRELIRTRSSLFGAVVEHRRAFGALKIDLLQVTLCNPFVARAALLAGFSRRVPTIAVEQLVLPSRRRRGRVLKWLASVPLAAHIAVGAASARDLRRFFGVPARKIRVIHNGVPDIDVVPHEFGRRPVIGSAARLEDQKALEVLVAALAEIPDTLLVLIGDGEQRADLERAAVEHGVADRVEFLGWHDDARPFIAGLDVFVLPSRDESFPLSIVEAMLAGTPVVATDVGSVAEAVIDGRTGLLVRSGDPKALAAAIRKLLGDEDLRNQLAGEARRHARDHFTDTAMARAYDRVWSEALTKRPWRRSKA